MVSSVRRSTNKGGIAEAFRFGLGAGAGFFLIKVVSVIIGLAFIVPGALLLLKENKKSIEERQTSNYILPIVLIGVGVIVGGGIGIGILFQGLSDVASTFEDA